jgi:acyl-CoA reductase-like NAD-dependent aldehyde dehydrogenase
MIQELKTGFNSGNTQSIGWRLAQIKALKLMLDEHKEKLLEVLHKDLKKSAFEGFCEISLIKTEINFAIKNLKAWVKPEKVKTSLVLQPGVSLIYKQPLGVVLIVGAWNYPLNVLLVPLIGALASGNCAVLKPSEIAAHTSKLLAQLIPQYLDIECIKVVEGGIPETTTLLNEPFDHIFFTGSGRVARIFIEAAAKHLTPVSLELGGKSPCVVDYDTDIKTACRRIVWGKFCNAGQTCVAPDYVLVHADIEMQLLEQLKRTIQEWH